MAKHPDVTRLAGDRRLPHGAKVGETVDLAGVPVRVVSKREAERADFVVCVGTTIPLMFADNVTCPCADCGDSLQHRPSAPKKPPKVCMDCARVRTLVHEARETVRG